MNRKLLVILSIVFIAASCKKDSNQKLAGSGYLVFGHFYGECLGEHCIDIFRLEENGLMEDTADNYPTANDFYRGNYVSLSQQQFDSTKDLITYFPAGLLQENTVIGQPDWADGGGLYIEYNFGGIRKFWLIDQIQDNVPDDYHSFMDKVNEKIERLE